MFMRFSDSEEPSPTVTFFGQRPSYVYDGVDFTLVPFRRMGSILVLMI